MDKQNPTGYSQVLEEWDTSGNVLKIYALGLTVIAQQSPAIANGEVLYLLRDGHGSARSLVNSSGQMAIGQVYSYDAFGNALGFNPANALTSHLYAGERTDPTGLMYLRQRYYRPLTATFTTMDSFAGTSLEPQSLHKYLYCHGDGVNFSDPSGQYEGLIGLLAATWSRIYIGVRYAMVVINAYGVVSNVLTAYQHYQYALDDFFDGDVWGGLGHCGWMVLHLGFAALSWFGLKGALTPPPAGGITGGLKYIPPSIQGGGAATMTLGGYFWEAIEVSPAFATWVYTELVAGVVAAGNAVAFMSASGGDGGLPQQEHHFASNKHSEYTPKYKAIADKYGLDLDGEWNKAVLEHLGRHSKEYHEFVLKNMEKAAQEAGGNKQKFLELYNKYVVKPVTDHPEMLRKAWWQE